LCVGISATNRSVCICPINRIGSQCLIRYTIPENNRYPICANDGQIIVDDEYNKIDYKLWNHLTFDGSVMVCVCRECFSGYDCYRTDQAIVVYIDKKITLSQYVFFHFIRIDYKKALERSTIFQMTSTNEDSITILRPDDFNLVFAEFNSNEFYLIDRPETNEYSEFINRTINSSNRCKNINEILDKNVANSHPLHRIKYYHLPCQKNSLNLPCFYDEVHFCLCRDYDHKRMAHCFEFDYQREKYESYYQTKTGRTPQCFSHTAEQLRTNIFLLFICPLFFMLLLGCFVCRI
jgi:hypothetical protein